MKFALALVFVAALGILSFRATHVKIADTLLDPIAKVDAQDEAMYTHSAVHMAQGGGWLTPMYQGRYGLYKPPLLAWVSGLSARIWGVSAFAVRLPVMLAGALTVCLLLLWIRRLGGPWMAATSGVLLLLSNHLWVVLSGLCLTDGLLTAAVAGAAFCLLFDPRLDSRASRLGFAAATAAGVMAKSVAGILPLFVLVVFWAVAKRGAAPGWRRMIGVGLVAAALILPWCLYQLAVHQRWFWNEFVLSEILTYGVSSPIQTSQESQAAFYLKRLWLLDPVLALCAVAGLPALWMGLRRRETPAAVLTAWLLVAIGIPLIWSYRNATYLLPAVPAMAILAAGYAFARVPQFLLLPATVTVAALLVVKIAFPAQAWGLDLRPPVLHPSVPLLSAYCRQNRGNELILVDPFEGFYSAVLPLPQVRYVFMNAAGVPPQGPLDLHRLGILLDAEEFHHLDQLRPAFRAELKAWALDSDVPIATAIVARNRGDVLRMIADRPASDFLLPADYSDELKSDRGHMPGARTEVFGLWLSRASMPATGARNCEAF